MRTSKKKNRTQLVYTAIKPINPASNERPIRVLGVSSIEYYGRDKCGPRARTAYKKRPPRKTSKPSQATRTPTTSPGKNQKYSNIPAQKHIKRHFCCFCGRLAVFVLAMPCDKHAVLPQPRSNNETPFRAAVFCTHRILILDRNILRNTRRT